MAECVTPSKHKQIPPGDGHGAAHTCHENETKTQDLGRGALSPRKAAYDPAIAQLSNLTAPPLKGKSKTL